MGIQCGIVGLPNVGKSTLFNALTRSEIPAENYPFCTIDPNVGIVPVPDPRLDKLTELVQPQKTLPTTVEFVDIAGLVAGAASGEGLGNKFLAHIRETDAIANVVRCFEDDDITHVAGKIDPLADLETISIELILADMESAEKALQRLTKQSKAGEKHIIVQRDLMARVCEHFNEGLPLRRLELSPEERLILREYCFLTIKPSMYIANVAEDGFEDNPHLARVQELAEREGAQCVAVCAAIEAEISLLDEDDRNEFLADLGMEEPGLDRVIRAAYELLGLKTYFTAGEKEVRAWTYKDGSTAPQTAGVIHTDFEKGFIRAEVVAYDDFVAHNGESGAKEAGKWRLEGKEYLVKDGDVMHFRFNV